MDTESLVERIALETDDVLCTIQLVKGNGRLLSRLFDQLVDLLVEAVFLELRTELAQGELSAEAYQHEVADLAARCHQAGLLPLGR